MASEFDNYIKNYRKNCNNALWLSGESSDYFAYYKANKLKEWFKKKLPQNLNILDFGCGDGLMCNYVNSMFETATVHGVDPSEKSITDAQKKFPHIRFKINSETTTNLDFADNSFELIYSAGTFHHIPFSMHENYVKELLRILKPKGKIVIFELNPINPLTVYTFKRNPIDYNAKMLTPWYAYSLIKPDAHITIKFICFFPKPLKWLRNFEPFLSKIPMGALYTIIAEK